MLGFREVKGLGGHLLCCLSTGDAVISIEAAAQIGQKAFLNMTLDKQEQGHPYFLPNLHTSQGPSKGVKLRVYAQYSKLASVQSHPFEIPDPSVWGLGFTV